MIEQMDYSQFDYSREELRIMRQMMTREWWAGWWNGWNREFAPGSLRTCSFIAFVWGYGNLETALVDEDLRKHLQRSLDMLADSQSARYFAEQVDPFTAKVGMKVGRTTAMARNFALLYGGGVGKPHG